MRPRLILAALVAATGILAACGGRDDEPAPDSSAQPGGVLLDAARQPLERAGAVEDITAARKGEIDEQLAEGEQ